MRTPTVGWRKWLACMMTEAEPVPPLREAGNQRGDYQGEIPPHGRDEEPDIGLSHDRVPQPDPYAPTHQDEGLYDEPPSGLTREWEDPYASLGGLARPDAYFGAIDFDCPPPDIGCGAPKGEKCHVYVERTGMTVTRKMPCVARIRLAHEADVL